MDETPEITFARLLAPEDIVPGVSIAITHQLAELFWPPCEEWQRGPLLRVTFLPFSDCQPLEVVSVCLPFVLVKQVDGKHRTLDVRRYRLARLSDEFARKAGKKLRAGTAKEE